MCLFQEQIRAAHQEYSVQMQQQQHGDTLDLNMRAGVTHDASDVTEAGVDASDVHATTSANETATAAANAAAMYSQMTVGCFESFYAPFLRFQICITLKACPLPVSPFHSVSRALVHCEVLVFGLMNCVEHGVVLMKNPQLKKKTSKQNAILIPP